MHFAKLRLTNILPKVCKGVKFIWLFSPKKSFLRPKTHILGSLGLLDTSPSYLGNRVLKNTNSFFNPSIKLTSTCLFLPCRQIFEDQIHFHGKKKRAACRSIQITSSLAHFYTTCPILTNLYSFHPAQLSKPKCLRTKSTPDLQKNIRTTKSLWVH